MYLFWKCYADNEFVDRPRAAGPLGGENVPGVFRKIELYDLAGDHHLHNETLFVGNVAVAFWLLFIQMAEANKSEQSTQV